MVAQNQPSSEKVTFKLLPQEKRGNYQFSGQFVSTRAALDKFGPVIIAAAHIMLLKEVRAKGGMDYLQVFEICGDRLWFIDDVSHVTALLPEDY